MTIRVKGYRNFRYKAQKTSSKVLEDFKQLSDSINQRLERRADFFRILLSISMILCFVSFLLIFVVIGIYLLPLFIIATLYCSHQTSKYYALQKNNYRYSLSKKIVSMLNRDIKESSVLTILADFNKAISKRKKLGKTSKSNLGNRKITNYFDPWLDIQGELSDHTKFKLNIIAILPAGKHLEVVSESGKAKTSLKKQKLAYS